MTAISTGKIIQYSRQVLILTFFLYLFLSPLYSQINPYTENDLDSLKSLLDNKSGTAKVDMLLEISQALWSSSLEESMSYAQRGLDLAEELNYLEGKADALNRIGNVHYLLRNHGNVIETYNSAFEIAQSFEDYRRMGIYLNNIGLLYRELNKYDSSEVYLLRALRAKEEYGDKDLISSTLGNLGVLYRDKEQYSLALEYFVRQIDILEEKRDIRSLSYVHIQAGEIFNLKKMHNESIRHFMISLNYAKNIADTLYMANAHHNLGKSLLEIDETDAALDNINKSMDLALAVSSRPLIRNNYQLIYRYHKKKKDYKAAIEYLTHYSTLKDSIRNHTIEERIKQMEGIFEIERQKSRIELLQKDNQIQEIRINRHDNIKILLILLLLILVVSIMIIAFRFRNIRKTNKLLKQKINKLEETNNKLRLSAKTLEQINATKNRFFSIIAHDLKNPFNALLGFSEIITSRFNQLNEKEIREYISIVHQSSRNLYKLLENLLKWTAAQTGTMHYLPEDFDLVSLIHSEINFQRINTGKKQINISMNLPDELIVNSDKLLLSSVIRNLFDNAIKFTPSGGSVKISAEKKDHTVIVEITDTGIGIPDDISKKLFRLDGEVSRRGTDNEEGGGLGLILCKDLIEKTGGKISFESRPGHGSRFWFSLPLREISSDRQ